jgi:hypothetical protein
VVSTLRAAGVDVDAADAGVVVAPAGVAVAGDDAAVVDKADAGYGCLVEGMSMLMPGLEATTRTSRSVYTPEHQMKLSLLGYQKRLD